MGALPLAALACPVRAPTKEKLAEQHGSILAQATRRLLHRHRLCLNSDVEGILAARVPIIKFTDKATGALVAAARALV